MPTSTRVAAKPLAEGAVARAAAVVAVAVLVVAADKPDTPAESADARHESAQRVVAWPDTNCP